jgi:phosphoribosylamine--glycine ligase
MNILLVGGGGREHAVAWKLRQSPRVTDLFVAPGNSGTAGIVVNLPVKASNLDGIVRAAREHHIDLVVVGPEDPLALGLVDRLAAEGIASFGPSKAAAELEASKAFSKDICRRYGIPHARGASFTSRVDARAYLERWDGVPVVKASGLALGKGAFLPDTKEEALQIIDHLMAEGTLGDAGRTVVIEERLAGREVSVFSFTDGRTVVPMLSACDYKRAFDGDEGPNTGGMGSYCPPPWYGAALAETVRTAIMEPTVRAMAAEGRPYRGVLYGGLMVTVDGPRVLEYNCRFGDPETQVVLPLLKSDLADILWAEANDRLHEAVVEWSDGACVGVVMASGGYPDQYQTGYPIVGLSAVEDGIVFHAGARLAEDDSVVTSGGRVLTVAAVGANLNEARMKAYRNVQRIHFTGCHYRKDIAAPSQQAVVE